MATALGYDDIFLQHRTGKHPERPGRLTSIMETLRGDALWPDLVPVDGRVEPGEWIRVIHSEEYIERLDESCKAELPFIDCQDSAICIDSNKVAHDAVAMSLAACDLVAGGEIDNAFLALRPPGHHAEVNASMGFCLFNNIAVAARYLQKRHGVKRILIFDWDVHHGNGTQHTFERDPTIFYCSMHQHPATCFPGTGWPTEQGEGSGKNCTLNLVMDPGTGDDEALEMFHTNFMTAAHDFRPDFILLSAGFDAHKKDPLAQLNWTEYTYEVMTREIKKLASEHCDGKLISFLEGGYQLGALSSSVLTHVKELTDK